MFQVDYITEQWMQWDKLIQEKPVLRNMEGRLG